MRFKRTRPETQSSKFNEEMNYKVSIEGLPDFFVNANNPGEVKIKMRKMLKKPDMLSKVTRVPDAAMKKHFRLKAQGKNDEPQTQEEQVMSEDHNPLVKAVSDVLSSGRSNMFRSVNKLDEKLSSKEKMKRGLYNQKGVMPVYMVCMLNQMRTVMYHIMTLCSIMVLKKICQLQNVKFFMKEDMVQKVII
jgi:hypothetical protein